MKSSFYPPRAPQRGSILKVILVCRISKESQDERSLNDQENLLRQWLQNHYDGPTDILVIAGQGSGESLLRDEAIQLEERWRRVESIWCWPKIWAESIAGSMRRYFARPVKMLGLASSH